MKFVKFTFAAIAALVGSNSLAAAQNAPPIPMKPPFVFETGDTWQAAGQRFRLYGVQSCLRGTSVKQSDGAKGDCGAASVSMLALLMDKTADLTCQPVATDKDGTKFVVCAAVTNDKPLDLGTALIVSGYGFAAVLPNGSPVHMNYLVAELSAKEARAGLWAATFEHPIPLLLRGNKPGGLQ